MPPAGFKLLLDAFESSALDALIAETPWTDHVFRIFGRELPMPRRIAFYGPHDYGYSGLVHQARPLTPCLGRILERVEALSGARFNTVLVNLYRDGADGMGWHADDDYPHGGHPAIASVSYGATRRFKLRGRGHGGACTLELPDRSLLLMAQGTQSRWQHCVPKTKRAVGPRVNLTFRFQAEAAC